MNTNKTKRTLQPKDLIHFSLEWYVYKSCPLHFLLFQQWINRTEVRNNKGFCSLGVFVSLRSLKVDHLWRRRGRRRRNMYSPQIYFIFFSFWAFNLLQHSTIAEPRNEIVRKGMWYIWTSMVGFISDTMSATSVFFLSDWLRSLANKNISIASFFSLRKL